MKLQRLNMDNSWHIGMGSGKFLLDPWLFGEEIDYFPWLNRQHLGTEALPMEEVPAYDFVFISQQYADHFHQETLQVLRPEKILVPKSIHKAVRKLLPDAHILIADEEHSDLFGTGISCRCISTKSLLGPQYDSFYLAANGESLLLATHGLKLNGKLQSELRNQPSIDLVMTPFNHYVLPFWLGGTISPGMKEVRKLMEALRPRHVVCTHDEDKPATGLASRMARITKPPAKEELLDDALYKGRLLYIEDYQPIEI